MRASILALLLALMAAPLAGAQGSLASLSPLSPTVVMVLVPPPEDPIPVGSGMVAMPVLVEYRYFAGQPTFEPTRIDLQVTGAPPWLVASLTPATVAIPLDFPSTCPCVTTRAAQATLLLSATADAPAFRQSVVTIVAAAHPNGPYAGSMAGFDVPVMAGFAPLTEVAASTRALALHGGERAEVPVTVANHGNGPIRVAWALLQAPKGVEVTLPDTVTVGAHQSGDAVALATAALQVRAVAGAQEGDVVVLASSAYALDAAIVGDHGTLTVHVAPEGGAGDVVAQSLGLSGAQGIALQAGTAVAGLAMSVLWARHRRLRT